jgi:hypothetical protein
MSASQPLVPKEKKSFFGFGGKKEEKQRKGSSILTRIARKGGGEGGTPRDLESGATAEGGTIDEEELQNLAETDPTELQRMGITLQECFQNERWSGELATFGSTYPGHMQPNDPPAFSNRAHQTASGQASRDAWPCIGGWEGAGGWRRDTAHTACAADGWSYGLDFADLRRALVEQQLVGEARPPRQPSPRRAAPPPPGDAPPPHCRRRTARAAHRRR